MLRKLLPYFYLGLGNVPELDLPLALPDFPGVCDDLAYSEEIGPGIAPSLIAALPDISQLTDITKSDLNLTNTNYNPLPAPPPPPPPPAASSERVLSNDSIQKDHRRDHRFWWHQWHHQWQQFQPNKLLRNQLPNLHLSYLSQHLETINCVQD